MEVAPRVVRWEHQLVVEEVVPPGESDGEFDFMDGDMACPPEDGTGLEGDRGNDAYNNFVDDFLSLQVSKWGTKHAQSAWC
jgi:hypothetical protein